MHVSKFLPNTMLLSLKRIFTTNIAPTDTVEPAQEPTPMLSPYILLNRKEQAKLVTDRLMALDTSADLRRESARELKALKLHHKVSWEKLGVTQDQLRMVEVLLVDEPKAVRVSKKTRQLSAALHGNTVACPTAKSLNATIKAERDAEILRLVALNFSQSNIAHRLGISRDTVIRTIRAANPS